MGNTHPARPAPSHPGTAPAQSPAPCCRSQKRWPPPASALQAGVWAGLGQCGVAPALSGDKGWPKEARPRRASVEAGMRCTTAGSITCAAALPMECMHACMYSGVMQAAAGGGGGAPWAWAAELLSSLAAAASRLWDRRHTAGGLWGRARQLGQACGGARAPTASDISLMCLDGGLAEVSLRCECRRGPGGPHLKSARRASHAEPPPTSKRPSSTAPAIRDRPGPACRHLIPPST